MRGTARGLSRYSFQELDALTKLPSRLRTAIDAAWEHNPTTNAFTSIVSPTDALRALSPSSKDGTLRNVTVALKDVFCTLDQPTTAASAMLQHYVSPMEATVVSRLRQAGAMVVGKTNMDEFGMGSSNLYSHFGPAKNPAGPKDSSEVRVTGGSSGGSAAAVASGTCTIALGSDTGGSVRLPAAYCGVVGLKPSYGLLSRWGMIAYASSLDCVGIMARRVSDVRSTLHVLSAFDEKDPTSASPLARSRADCQYSSWLSTSHDNLSGLRIGVPVEYFLSEVSPVVLPAYKRVLQHLQEMGATLHSVSIPSTPHALSAYYVIASAEASSNLARFDGTRYGTRNESTGKGESLYCDTRTSGFGPEVQKRILIGTHALSADAFENYFLQAQRVRRLVQLDFNHLFRASHPLSDTFHPTLKSSGVDLILHPSAINIAPLSLPSTSSNEAYVQDVLNVPASLAGLPAMSIPAGQVEGWPVGVQLASQWGCEQVVMRVGECIEECGERGVN